MSSSVTSVQSRGMHITIRSARVRLVDQFVQLLLNPPMSPTLSCTLYVAVAGLGCPTAISSAGSGSISTGFC